MPVTRFGLEGYGVRRAGSFSGKTPDAGSGPHPVGILTRFGLEGYGVRRAGDFSGKTSTEAPPPPPTGQGGASGGWRERRKRGEYDFLNPPSHTGRQEQRSRSRAGEDSAGAPLTPAEVERLARSQERRGELDEADLQAAAERAAKRISEAERARDEEIGRLIRKAMQQEEEDIAFVIAALHALHGDDD